MCNGKKPYKKWFQKQATLRITTTVTRRKDCGCIACISKPTPSQIIKVKNHATITSCTVWITLYWSSFVHLVDWYNLYMQAKNVRMVIRYVLQNQEESLQHVFLLPSLFRYFSSHFVILLLLHHVYVHHVFTNCIWIMREWYWSNENSNKIVTIIDCPYLVLCVFEHSNYWLGLITDDRKFVLPFWFNVRLLWFLIPRIFLYISPRCTSSNNKRR